MADRTRSRVAGLTLAGSFSTRETVMCETPARTATSAMTGVPLRPDGSGSRGCGSVSMTDPFARRARWADNLACLIGGVFWPEVPGRSREAQAPVAVLTGPHLPWRAL